MTIGSDIVSQSGFGEWSIPFIGLAGLLVWIMVLYLERDHLRDRKHLPMGVRDAAMVGLLCVTSLGSISALGFPNLIAGDLVIVFAALWRAAVLACGVYALIASARDIA